MTQRTEERECLAELHRLRGVFLAATGADEIKIEGSFCEAIRIAKKQLSRLADGLNDRILTTSSPPGTEPHNLVISLLDRHNI